MPIKNLIGFAAALGAVIAIALLSWRADRARLESQGRVRHTLEVIRKIEALVSRVKDAETGQRGTLLTSDSRYLVPYQQAVERLPAELEAVRDAVAESPAQLRRLDQLAELTHAKLGDLASSLELQQAGKAAEALALMRSDRGRELMERIRVLADQLEDGAQQQLAISRATWEEAVTWSSITTWVGSGVLLLLILLSAIMAAREVRKQRRDAWLKNGENELGRAMLGEQRLSQLGHTIVRTLASRTGASVGALYLAERAGHLTPAGSFGLGGAAPEAGGVTRQALADNQLIQLDRVPDGFFKITAGLGASPPRHLVVAPLVAEGAAIGVMELGFLSSPPAHALELLRRAGAGAGLALRSAQYRVDLENYLEETQRQAEELQAQQEELRVNNEELEQQSRALQDSQQRLQNQQAELEQINTQLEEQAEALGQQRDDLAAAHGELTRANTYKSEFLANMSHELRTPLNSSLILAKLLMDNRDGNLTGEQVKFARTIYAAGNDLLMLINDILDLSKIEAGKLDVRPESVPLARVVDDLVTIFRPVAEERHLQLETSLDPGLPQVITTDVTRLLQILKNLLSNALKFTEQGGVSLTISAAGDGRVAFAVKDTGIGIPADKHELIFEAFRQADGTTSRKYGGTGLGLSISRDLARLLGGQLGLDSAPGRGSTFTLELPLTLSSVAAAPPAVAPPRLPRATIPPRPRSEPKGTPPVVGRTILVIEDDAAFAQVVADLARELDFVPLLAGTAEEGLRLAREQRPSAVVLDVGLPDRSGLTVLDALKHDPRTRHIPVHVVSATDHVRTALEMGAAGYALKPVAREQVAGALRRLEDKLTQKVRRVLVVEDDPVHRESTCRLLEAGDVECVGVDRAGDALVQLVSQSFDCMVLDLSLPDRSGLSLLQEMAARQEGSFPPVIVYTGRQVTREEEEQLRRFSSSIIIKGARSPERLLDEVTLFLHQVEADLPPDRQRLLRDARSRESVFEGRRILLVEDDVRNIFALSSLLEPRGARVEIARNGKDALALLERERVDLVLMDLMMPEMDGLEATRRIRARPELARLPIIALTAKAMADDREQALAAGASDYVSKPLDADKLLSLIRVWMPK